MPLRLPKATQISLLLLLVLLLGGGFASTSLVSYYTSREALRNNIINSELPLTSDTVYSEIQKDLVRPVLISSMMARDTFVRDWVVAGEQDPAQMTRYLQEIMSNTAPSPLFLSPTTPASTTRPRAYSSRSMRIQPATSGISTPAACRRPMKSTSMSTWPTLIV